MEKEKISTYNYIFNSVKYGYLLYNGLTNSFAKINSDLALLIEKAKVNPFELKKTRHCYISIS